MAMTRGEWKKALTLSEQALAILRDQCVGVTWELNMAQNLVIWALMYLGELGEVSRQVPALLANARSSGNLYIATELCTRSNYVWLAADDPDEGERETIESIARWSHKGFHRQHYSAMLARVQTALYRGDADAAWRLLAEQESMLRRSYAHARPGHSDRVALPARALRAGHGRTARSPAADSCPWLAPARGASPGSACRGPIRLPCCSRPAIAYLEGRHSACRCSTSTTPPIDSTAPT